MGQKNRESIFFFFFSLLDGLWSPQFSWCFIGDTVSNFVGEHVRVEVSKMRGVRLFLPFFLCWDEWKTCEGRSLPLHISSRGKDSWQRCQFFSGRAKNNRKGVQSTGYRVADEETVSFPFLDGRPPESSATVYVGWCCWLLCASVGVLDAINALH